MIYRSTRNNKIEKNAAEAILAGIAEDGGLFMLNNFSAVQMDVKELLPLSEIEMAERIFARLFDDFSSSELHNMVTAAYKGKFESDELTPTIAVGDRFVTELFRGPTSAFKDVALSMLPQLMSAARKKLGETDETVILTATSGDTGKAALEGFSGAEGIRIIVFYPESGVSAVQKAQMVTQEGDNVCVCAVRGNFDDAQAGVKKIFAEYAAQPLPGVQLSSANSINIGRLVPQIVYYFKAYCDLVNRGVITAGEPVNFAVPTGNFGDILAGYFAKLMGLPVGKLICASNANNVLTDFILTGVYDRKRPFYKTLSPSMDILVSSNLERLLYLLCDSDDHTVSRYMKDLAETGRYEVSPEIMARLKETFCAGFCDDRETLAAIGRIYRDYGYLCDTHTAVAFAVSERTDFSGKTVVLATASPYKFPVAVLSAIGETPVSDEFTVMRQLNAKTGVPIPRNLTGLDKKPVLHHDVTEKDNMAAYVYAKAGQPTWKK